MPIQGLEPDSQNAALSRTPEPRQGSSESRSYTNRASDGVLEFYDYRRRRANRRPISSDPDRFWQVVVILAGAIVLLAMGIL